MGYDPQTTADAKKTSDNLYPPLRTKPRRCGHCASLRALRVIAGIARHCGQRPANSSSKKTSNNTPHHYGQIPVVAGNARHCGHCASLRAARHCGQRPANSSSKKSVKQPTSDLRKRYTIITRPTPIPPLRTNPRRCGQCASLRAMRVIAGYDPQPPN
ncbi:MAG: hypothetical protein LBG17_05385 [Bacteroidales bacterium]|nr:hypothetical protein [Bacteroidales bacterium]